MEARENNISLMVVDDEPDVLESLAMIFRARGYSVTTASSGSEAVDLFGREPVPVVVCDHALPDSDGIGLLERFREVLPEVQMIMVTGKGTIDLAVSAMKAGVFDFVTKPVDPEYLFQLTSRAQQLYDALTEKKNLEAEVERMGEQEIIGRHPSIKSLLRLIHMVAPTDSSVIIEGESGTGKELVARLIHKRSRRARGPFVAVDCGAIPEGLVESELFGHEKGAFTGAAFMSRGRFERASRGTLFLDEITSLPLQSQAKLLRALQEKVIERLGGQKPIPVDIRLIAASNSDLQDAVSQKTFREDLYYRLNIMKIRIPPLRERKSDIALLAHHFIRKHRDRVNSSVGGISKEALQVLTDYHWPGNVRELENVIEHALIMAGSPTIMPQDLPAFENDRGPVSRLDDAERNIILQALNEAGGNKYRAAKILGIPRSSLYSKLKKFDIS
ncbi:MAG: sigma-54 dependent transcriptional regulator [Thermodesulfovibrionales bacterium]